jgi:pimeloyl-ACP methyl ester carboxylesterase
MHVFVTFWADSCVTCCLQFPYIRFLQMLFNQASSHPIILMEFGFISLRFCWRAGEVDDAAHAVAEFVRQHGWSQACIVGHSYGTFVASRICQMHPDMVQSLVSVLAFLSCRWDLKYMLARMI